jgi:hypothetical protein
MESGEYSKFSENDNTLGKDLDLYKSHFENRLKQAESDGKDFKIIPQELFQN